jgi:hypothetical protein
MKKVWLISGLIILGAAFASISADINKIPPEKEKIILHSDKTNPVTFVHSTHMALSEMDCGKCHGPADEKEQKFTCTACHATKGVKLSIEDTFHNFCIECHKKPEYKDKKAPVSCTGCHKEAMINPNKS